MPKHLSKRLIFVHAAAAHSGIFYDSLEEGPDLLVDALGFEVKYRDDGIAVVERDMAKAYLVGGWPRSQSPP
jgi:hypothetical protein